MLFITLGPSGTNHDFVTQNYLRFKKLKDADIKLIDNFFFGLKMMADGRADYMVQAAVNQIVRTWSPKRTFYMGLEWWIHLFSQENSLRYLAVWISTNQDGWHFNPQRGIT